MGLFREIFGPSRDEIWSQLSQEIGARFQKGDFFTSGKLTLSHRQWEITLDTYTVSTGKSSTTYTRLRAPYINQDGFRFTVYRKGIFSDLGKMLFGLQDIEIGDPFFDEQFIIQGTSEYQVQQLLANERIRQLIQNQLDIHFQVRDDEGWFGHIFPEGVDELCFRAYGVIKDKERLKALFDLFAAVLDELCRLGSAYETVPEITL